MAEVNLYRDSFQNWKSYGIPKAQLIIADIPYGIGEDAYGSNPLWYKGGDNANGESDKAGKSFFHSDYVFRISEFLHFTSQMLKLGLYNYQYVWVPSNSDKADLSFIEGDFYNTENEYLIYIYYRGFSDRYDRLLNVHRINYNMERN